MSEPVIHTEVPEFSLNGAYAYGIPMAKAVIRSAAEDFQVDEDLGLEPSGEGQHLLLHIKKRNTNTEWLARQLARVAGVKSVDVSYAGLKDRKAVTTQWFSLDLAGKELPDFSALECDDIQILSVAKHGRKLRRGTLKGNHFILRLRELSGDKDALEQRLQKIKALGIPNYFGSQRFGRDAGNLLRAQEMFNGKRIKDRHKRGLYLSAARSYLFNQVLSKRIEEGNWNTPLMGDALQLNGSGSFFNCEAVDEEIIQRMNDMDIHPTGPLWGRGHLSTTDEAAQLETATLSQLNAWQQGLESMGLSQARRALRVSISALDWQFQDGDTSLQLKFFLPAGSYATSVLRELINVSEVSSADGMS